MNKLVLFTSILIVLFLTTGCNNKAEEESIESIKTELKEILSQQEKAWSNGDFEGFMEPYWKSDSLKFLSSGRVTYGWNQTLANYKKGYPTKDDTGKLEFELVSVEKLNTNHLLMIGKYKVIREKQIEGYFSLVWKKINNQWKIIFDHSS